MLTAKVSLIHCLSWEYVILNTVVKAWRWKNRICGTCLEQLNIDKVFTIPVSRSLLYNASIQNFLHNIYGKKYPCNINSGCIINAVTSAQYANIG